MLLTDSGEVVSVLRILIADDHDLMRRGIRSLLESCGWTICAEAARGREAVEKAAQLKPDVAILDIAMPQLNGLDAARRIQKASPRTEILILSAHYSDQLTQEIISAKIKGYVVKSDADRDLPMAIEALSKHKPFFSPLATDAVLRSVTEGSSRGKVEPKDRRLSPREREILQLLSEGKSSKEVASALDISTKTAETHRANIMRKLELHNVAELVRYAVRTTMIEP
jgi:DNA-binding NarL/FixJ family response regulator